MSKKDEKVLKNGPAPDMKKMNGPKGGPVPGMNGPFPGAEGQPGEKKYKRTSSLGMGRGPGGGGRGPGGRGRGPGAGRMSFREAGKNIDLKVIKRVLRYLTQHKVRFTIAVLCIITSAITSVLTATALGNLIDNYINPMSKTGVFDAWAIIKYLLKVGMIYLISTFSTFFNNRMFLVITQDVMRQIRNDMFSHMQTLPIRYFDSNTYGNIMSHYTNDTDTLRQLLSQSIPNVLSAAITLVSIFVTMISTSVWFTLFAMIFVFLIMKVTTSLAMRSGRMFLIQQESLGEMNGFIEEMVDGQRVIKVFNHENAAIEEFDETNENLFNAARSANAFAGMMGPINGGLGNLQYVLTAILGAVLVTLGVQNLTITGFTILTLGNVITFLQLGRRFAMTISNTSQQMNSIVMAMAGANRIFDLMDAESEVDDGEVTLVNVREKEDGTLEECEEETRVWAWKVPMGDRIILIKCEGDVRMSHVDFGYTDEKTVLHDITLYAEPGQKVAFVGATGAGKTTITNLINRFYDIQNGDITYDGIPVKNIKKNALRASLGMVLQDVNLFTGTIRENIRYGRLTASDEEVVEAAKRANAHDFITRLPNGYDTVIDGSGSNLSQGQRQLISIARAAIEDPPVMILDEATSSIDTRTEAIVQRGMDELMKGRTVFVIAHRLSTVMNSDVIMVLEHGRIIERGTHEQLIEQQGKYYQPDTGAFELE